jgi:hypothetical protein
MRSRTLTLTALALVAGLSLTACQSDDGGEADGGGKAASTVSDGGTAASAQGPDGSSGAAGSGASGSGASGSGTAASGTAASGGKGGAATASGSAGTSGSSGSSGSKVAACRTAGLKISAADATIGDEDPATVAVTFQNAGSAPCSLNAYAGVDLSTNAGALSAERGHKESVPDAPVVLKPGEKTYFGIWYPVNKTGGSGVRVTGLTVTPPDETKSVRLSWPGQPSLPVSDGDQGQGVEVGPMGSVGQGEG